MIVPSIITTKRRVIFAATAWDAIPTNSILMTMNLRGVIADLGINIHFRLFVTGPFSDDNETNDIYLFLIVLVEILKQQIVYDIAVELSTICDGIGNNSYLEDVQQWIYLGSGDDGKLATLGLEGGIIERNN
ncbi:7529_t:CDS:2 [Ambispora gerdemannii]|uniref:7529_t:CDS:1 n=1 Tax=Ambispora gerdemannii TaxID=144530 RepID=A0A9N9EGZ0_9GLOM|nr:7529_t:CDS:2 [Ambispora gerdemannii]